MAEFFNVLSPDDARELLLSHIRPLNRIEKIPTTESLGRTIAGNIVAPHSLPTFRRSTMDGFAVRAADTFGAGETLPAFLKVVGEVLMGEAATIHLDMGQAAIVHTGGMVPSSADAVVPIEHTQSIGPPSKNEFPYEIEILRSVAVGQNVIQVGEDVSSGERILPSGAILRPQDISGLLALGILYVDVRQKPKVIILATGDEVVPPEVEPGPGKIRDINSYTVANQCLKAGAAPLIGGIVRDNLDDLQVAAASALASGDMLVVSAGSSVSVRDMTVTVIENLGHPGVLLHGVATRPGKPTILGVVDGKPILGLPGNPVSAMVQFDMFGLPAIHRLLGVEGSSPRNSVWAKLTQNIPSESGREDYVPARVAETPDGFWATPIFGKSNLIYTLVRADGLIKVPLNRGGLLEGDSVEVRFF